MLLKLFRLTFLSFLFLLLTAELGIILPKIAYAESKKEEKKPKKEEKKSSKQEKETVSKKKKVNLKEEDKVVIESSEKEEIKGEEILDPKNPEVEIPELVRIDAVLIIDSSRSMQKTDPEKLREQAAKLFFRLLSEGDRLAIISFDKETRQVLPLTEINLQTIATFDRAISAIKYEGGFTDIEAPLAMAYKILSEQGRPDVFKSVLLLSDGKMDPYPERGTAEELISETKKNILPRYKSSKIKLYTVALSEQSDKNLLGEFAKLTEGVNLYAPDSSLIHKKFGEMFLSIKKPQMITLEGGIFEIDSAVKEVTFFISKKDALATLNILDPQGNTIVPDDFVPKIKWYSDDKVDLITIYEPMLGRWQIRSNEKIEGFARLLSDPKLHVKFPAGNFKFGESAAAYAKLTNLPKDIKKEDLENFTFYTYKIIDVNSGDLALSGMLNDKGEEGDQIAGDGVYSAVLKFDKEGEFQALFGVTTPTFTRQQRFPMTVSKEAISIKMLYENAGEEESKEDSKEAGELKKDDFESSEEGSLNLGKLSDAELEAKAKELEKELENETNGKKEAPEIKETLESKENLVHSSTLKGIQVNLNEELEKLVSPKVKLILKKINLEKPISKEAKKKSSKKEQIAEKNKDTFIVTLKPLKNNPLAYEYPIEKLEGGEYKVYARLTAEDENGKEYTAISSTIKIDLDEKESLFSNQINELLLISGVSSIFISFIWISVLTLLIKNKNQRNKTIFEIPKEGIIAESLRQQIESLKAKVSSSKRIHTEKDLEIFAEVADVFQPEKAAAEDSEIKPPETEILTAEEKVTEEVKEPEAAISEEAPQEEIKNKETGTEQTN